MPLATDRSEIDFPWGTRIARSSAVAGSSAGNWACMSAPLNDSMSIGDPPTSARKERLELGCPGRGRRLGRKGRECGGDGARAIPTTGSGRAPARRTRSRAGRSQRSARRFGGTWLPGSFGRGAYVDTRKHQDTAGNDGRDRHQGDRARTFGGGAAPMPRRPGPQPPGGSKSTWSDGQPELRADLPELRALGRGDPAIRGAHHERGPEQVLPLTVRRGPSRTRGS